MSSSQVVKPTVAPATQPYKFGCASDWTQDQLDQLGVVFKTDVPWHWKDVLDKAGDYTPEQKQSPSFFLSLF